MGQITLVISDRAETYLRSKNLHKGDMGNLVSQLLEKEAKNFSTEINKK